MNELDLLIGKVARNSFALGFGLGVLFVFFAAMTGYGLFNIIN
jgi:hypothetical protein